MSRSIFQPEWRTQNRRKRRFYARYMGWLEKTGFVIVTLLLAAFAGSFFYEVDEWVSAEDVAIGAEETPVLAAEDGAFLRFRVSEGEVHGGDAIAEIAGLEGTVVLVSPGDGFVFPSEIQPGHPVQNGDRLAVIRDYRQLVVRPKLGGKSISKANVGQPAELTNVRIQNEGDTLLRASLDGKSQVSRRLAGDAVKKALQESLKGRAISARDDIPLQISEVNEVEIEAGLKATDSNSPGIAFDPDPGFKLKGKVSEGKHVLSAQLGDLPPEVRRNAVEALRKQLAGKAVEFGGQARTIEDLIDPRFVVKLTAENAASGANSIQGASLKRTYDAVIRLENVPSGLVERLKEAHRQGKQVTAKVQVRTGSRPIAYFLLRRS